MSSLLGKPVPFLTAPTKGARKGRVMIKPEPSEELKEHVDTLRRVRYNVHPESIFRMYLDAETFYECTGAQMIENAEAAVELFDAILSDDKEAIKKAAARINESIKGDPEMWKERKQS